jgi:hypothetical protein
MLAGCLDPDVVHSSSQDNDAEQAIGDVAGCDAEAAAGLIFPGAHRRPVAEPVAARQGQRVDVELALGELSHGFDVGESNGGHFFRRWPRALHGPAGRISGNVRKRAKPVIHVPLIN